MEVGRLLRHGTRSGDRAVECYCAPGATFMVPPAPTTAALRLERAAPVVRVRRRRAREIAAQTSPPVEHDEGGAHSYALDQDGKSEPRARTPERAVGKRDRAR